MAKSEQCDDSFENYEESMKILMHHNVSKDDAELYQRNYFSRKENNSLDEETKFQYAWCLTHSNRMADLKNASVIFEELFKEGTEELKRDCLFFLAVAETKQRSYLKAKKYVEAFLSVEPSNVQAKQLLRYIEKYLKKDGVRGMALVGAAALFGGAVLVGVGTMVVGGALGLAFRNRK